MITFEPQKIAFDRTAGTLLVGIDPVDMQGHILALQGEAAQRNLEPKKNFHITVIGFRTGKAIKESLNKLTADERKRKLQAIEKLTQECDWKFSTEGQKIYFVEKDYEFATGPERRASIVQMISLLDMAIFYRKLNDLLRTNFPVPSPHITLFVGGTDPEKSKMGIGIDSIEELAKLQPQELSI